jgi:two-component system, NarL family, nitrate/nitrite response regulator NarL
MGSCLFEFVTMAQVSLRPQICFNPYKEAPMPRGSDCFCPAHSCGLSEAIFDTILRDQVVVLSLSWA